jgi:hypothetical protein
MTLLVTFLDSYLTEKVIRIKYCIHNKSSIGHSAAIKTAGMTAREKPFKEAELDFPRFNGHLKS